MVQEHGIHPLLIELGLAPSTPNANHKNNDKESESQITALDVLQRLLESSAFGGDQMKAAYESLVRAAYESLRDERNSPKPLAGPPATAAPSSDPTSVPTAIPTVTTPSAGPTTTAVPSEEPNASSNNSEKATPGNHNHNNSTQLEKITPTVAAYLDMMDIDADAQPGPGDTVEPTNNNQDVLQENENLNVSNNDSNSAQMLEMSDVQETEKTERKDAQETQRKDAQETEKKDNKTTATKQFDYRTRHIALHLCYEGKHYSGLAQNVGMESDNSVERKLFQALQTTHLIQSRDTAGYSRCGRTDRGVSAAGQVVALRLKSAIPRNASWDPEGNHPVSDLDDRFPKNSFQKMQVWVPPKPKKNKKQKKNDNDNSNSDKDNQQQSDAAVGDTPGPTPGSTSVSTDGPTADPNPGATPGSTSGPTASDAADTANEATQQGPKRVLKAISEYPYDKMLNGLLPNDIRILGWCPVSDDFSARFSSKTRTYRYFFVQRDDLNLEAMREGLKLLEGNHDFRNLCKMNVVEVSNFERKIHSAELISLSTPDAKHDGQSGLCYFQIQGQAFLWHQIRCIVSVLFMIGRGLESPSVITELLNVQKHPAKPSYPLASEYPLVLHDCGYPNLSIGYSVQNCWTVTCQMEEQWESLVLEATRVRNSLERLKEVDSIRKKELVEFATGRLLERSKKQQRNKQIDASSEGQEDWMSFFNQIKKEEQSEAEQQKQSKSLTWGEAVDWLKRWKIVVDYNGLRDHIHIPLLKRSKGTTYEEKIEALQQSSTKRSQRFEENAAKKQKSTKESDAQFYEHMLKQGGSGIGPTQGHTAGPTPDPTLEPASGNTAGPTPEPNSDATADPTSDPTGGTTADPTPEPTGGTTADLTPEP